MKIKFFKKEKNFSKEKESLWLNINFYWKFAVFFLFAVVVSSALFGRYLFMQTNQELVLSKDKTSPQVETISKERIDSVLEYFSNRDKKSEEILNSPAPVIDPSL